MIDEKPADDPPFHQHRLKYDPTDFIGRKFGLLTVLEYLGRDPDTRAQMYRCECSCRPGAGRDASRTSLVNGGVKSCGCLRSSRRSTADQTRYFAPEQKRAKEMSLEPQTPYKIVIHR